MRAQLACGDCPMTMDGWADSVDWGGVFNRVIDVFDDDDDDDRRDDLADERAALELEARRLALERERQRQSSSGSGGISPLVLVVGGFVALKVLKVI